MTRLALLASLSFAAATPAAASSLFLSTEHPFPPDSPGAVVKMEVRGARSVDVRLYRLPEPERFFAQQRNLRHIEMADRSLASASGQHSGPEGRIAGPVSLARKALSSAWLDAHRALDRGLTPVARALLASAASGPRRSGEEALPFLNGLDLVERWDLACGEGGPEYAYCDLDIGPRPAGVYLVEAVSGHDVAYVAALFSRLALLARRTEDQIVLMTVDSQTGQAIGGARLSILTVGQPPVHGTTSRQGLFQTKAQPKQLTVVARSGPHTALLEVDAVLSGLPDSRTFIATDRGEYRPGERVVFHGFTRTGDRLALPHLGTVEVSAFDSRGSLFYREARAISEQGGFGGELALPVGLPQGLFRLVATAEDHSGSAELVVRAAPEPAFALEIALEATSAGAPVRARVRASVEGKPLPSAQLRWRAVRFALDEEELPSLEEVERGEAETGTDGQTMITFETSKELDARYELSVLASDSEGRLAISSSRVRVLRRPFRVSLSAGRRLFAPGSPVGVQVAAQAASGLPIPVELEVQVLAARTGSPGEGSHDRVFGQFLRTGPDGHASFSFTPSSTGYYEIEALQSGVPLAETFLYVTQEGGDIPFTPDTLALVPDKATYSVGETARILVLAPFDSADSLLTVEGEGLLRHDALPIRGASAVYALKILPAMAPYFTFSAQAVSNERAWARERLLRVSSESEILSVRGALDRVGDDRASLEVEVLDAAGKPIGGAEVFATARDARSVATSSPPMLAFFHPERRSNGVTESSTSYRNSSSGTRPRAAYDGTEEGYLPFKGLSQGPPRVANEGTLIAATAVTDSRGRASFEFALPPDLPGLALAARAAAGPAMGEWLGSHELGASRPAQPKPRFTRQGDQWNAAQGPGLDSEQPGFPVFPSEALISIGESGFAQPGRSRITSLSQGEEGTLYLAADPRAAALGARSAMGSSAQPMTAAALARVLARVAERRAGVPLSGATLAGCLADTAVLVGLAHPEGQLGAFDGAPADPELTATSLIALLWEKAEGVEVEEGLLVRAAQRISEDRRHADALAALALALAGNPVGERLKPLMESERKGGWDHADRALLVLALHASGRRAEARGAAMRLEKSARSNGPLACFAESCLSEGLARSALRSTALATLALRTALPQSALIAPAVRFLLSQRGQGDWGEDVAGGLAALAIVTAADSLPASPSTVTVEIDGRKLITLRLSSRTEKKIELTGREMTLIVADAPVIWRVDRRWRTARPGHGSLKMTRTLRPLDPKGNPEERLIRVGDRVQVSLTIEADASSGPLEIEDPYPAGLAPIEQEGEREPFRLLDQRAHRFFAPDRVIFSFPKLDVGKTVLRWEAFARHAGKFAAAPAHVRAGELWGRSGADGVEIEVAP